VVERARRVDEALRGLVEIRHRRAEHRAMTRPQAPGAHEDQRGGGRKEAQGGDKEGAHRACQYREGHPMATHA